MRCALRLWWSLSVVALAGCGSSSEGTSEPSPPPRVALGPPPAALVGEWGLSPRYVKHVDVGGFPILGSAAPSDYALLEAAYLVRQMIGHRPELLRALAEGRVRGVVMATSELTTDVPEHSDLAPASYWNRRARGLGPTAVRPAMSGAEENLLALEGDPYSSESIFVHEFAHAGARDGARAHRPDVRGAPARRVRERAGERALRRDLRDDGRARVLGGGDAVLVRHEPRG